MDPHSTAGLEQPPTSTNVSTTSTKGVNRRVAIASSIGTLIEFYDFMIYGTAAAVVFPQILFPALGGAAGTAASFATFGVAFAARPLGGVIFGHLGDRLGRKKTLITSLMVMGVATVAIGMMPTAASIGVAAPILVIALRIAQGLAAGGEWAGATLFSAEYAPAGKRGFWTMFPLLGGTVAMSLASATFLASSLLMSQESFLSWGWRLPFLASIVLIAVGLWVRLSLDETPVFKNEFDRGGRAKLPIAEAFRTQWRQILLAGGVGLLVFSFFYVNGTYMTSFATGTLGLDLQDVLLTGIVSGVFLTAATLAGGRLSDRFGRRPVLMGAQAVGVVWSLSMFHILGTNSVATFMVVAWVTMIITGIAYGPLGAFIPEQFHTRHRFTATGISYNLGGVLGGAAAPLLAPVLEARFGTYAFGIFLAGLCLVALLCTAALRETRDSDMSSH